MLYAQTLRETSAKIAHDIQAIINKAEKDGNRGLTVDEQTSFDRLVDEHNRIDDSIKSAEKASSILSQLADLPNNHKITATQIEQMRDEFPLRGSNAYSDAYDKHFWNFVRKGGDEKAVGVDVINFLKSRLPQTVLNTMSTTTGSQGGFTIPQGFSDQLEVAMKWFGGMEIAGQFDTDTGNPLPYPTVNDTAQMGRIIGQNTQVTQNDVAFGQIIFNAYIFSSDLVLVPFALLQDSYFDLMKFLAEALGIRLGRLKNNKLTVGSGTNEPTGVLTAAVAAGNIYTMPTGNATGLTYDVLVEGEHTVDPAYRAGSTWMFHDSTLKQIKHLKDASGRPLWQPGLTSSLQNGAGDFVNKPSILDYPYVINNDMPVMAANANSILFGQFSKYKVRRVLGESTMVFNERYADYLQKGIMAYLRLDGNLIDAGSHPIAVVRNSAT